MLPSKHQVSYSHCTFLLIPAHAHVCISHKYSHILQVMQNTYMYHVDACLSIFTSTNMVKGLQKKSFLISKTKKQYMTCMKFKYQIVSKILPTLQIQSSTLHVVLQQVCLLNLRCPSQLSFPGFCL